MKKLLLMAIALFGLILTSCSDTDDSSIDPKADPALESHIKFCVEQYRAAQANQGKAPVPPGLDICECINEYPNLKQ